MIKKSFAAFLIGFLLLGINLSGLFKTLRLPLHPDNQTADGQARHPSYDELVSIIESDATDRPAYLQKANTAIHEGVIHDWIEEGDSPARLRVPLSENYLLFTASYLKPSHFLKYEYTNWKKAAERGVGLCSQQSIIAAEAFAEKGIPSEIVGLDGHVILQAEADPGTGNRWILDPDYGVIVPYGISEIEEEPERIEPYYREKGYKEAAIANLVRIYGPEGNRVFEGPGARSYYALIWEIERLAYAGIWLIPLVLMIPWIFQLIRRQRRSESKPTLGNTPRDSSPD